jgi:hypothetical protein
MTNAIPKLMTDPSQITAFMLAGNAKVTFRSTQTGTHYTYWITRGKPSPVYRDSLFFVKVLSGPDNFNDYTYLGMIEPNQYTTEMTFRITQATKYPTSQSVKAFSWAWSILAQGRLPQGLEVWHEGRCGRCGRLLTNDTSIAFGFGPECLELSGMV